MSYQSPNSYKIYSRKRFCLNFENNQKNRNFKRKLKIIVPILFVMIIAFLTCYSVYKSIDPIFETICKDEAKSIATIITNEQSTIVMRQHSYDELFNIQKGEDGNIQMISANILTINEITSDIAIKIQEELNKNSEKQIKIPLGSVTGIKFISGYGPKVNIQLATVGSVDTNLKSEFVEQGVNQTLHRVYLEIETKVNILTPYKTIEDKIFNQVLLTENVILGEIPLMYLE